MQLTTHTFGCVCIIVSVSTHRCCSSSSAEIHLHQITQPPKLQGQLLVGGHILPGREPRFMASQLANHRYLAGLLRDRSAGKPCPHTFIYEGRDVCAAAPEDLVRGLDPAPANGQERAWYFFSPALYHDRAGGSSSGPAPRRRRQVVAGETLWNSEKGNTSILGPDGKSIGAYACKLSYVYKPAGAAKSSRKKSLGWIMLEIGLEQQHAAGADQQLVLCKVYKSPRTGPETSTEATSAGAEVPQVEQTSLISGDGPNPSSTSGLGSRNATAIKEAAAGEAARGLNVVMKLGGSTIKSSHGMKVVAKAILGFPAGECPVVVLSAMGDTITNILLAAEKAVSCGSQKVCEIHDELAIIIELHLRTVDELGLDGSTIADPLRKLEEHFEDIAINKELTPTTRQGLVSLSESLAATIFSAYLNKLGKKSRTYDVYAFGVITTDDSSNEVIHEATHLAIAKKLGGDWIDGPAIPIVTSFPKEGCKSNDIITFDSDLTTTIIAKALAPREVQIWEDVDVVLTGDPNICTNVLPVPNLTIDEAVELVHSGHQGLQTRLMQLDTKGGLPSITLKNSSNHEATGTTITQTRDMSKSILRSIVLKSNIFMLNIKSTGVLNQCDFQARVFSFCKDPRISIDHGATSGCKICLILDLSKVSSLRSIQREVDVVVEELEKVATVVPQHKSIVSLIGNIHKSSFILWKAFGALHRIAVNVEGVSQRPSKVLNVSLVVHASEAKRCVQVLHSTFLEAGCFLSKVEWAENEGSTSPVNPSAAAAASSGDKRKADDHDHPHARPAVLQRTDTNRSRAVNETERSAFSEKVFLGNPTELFEDNGGNLGCCVMDAGVPQVQPDQPLSVDDYQVDNGFGIEVQRNEPVLTAVPEAEECSSVPEAVQPENETLAEVGECSSGPPGVLEKDTEGRHQPVTDDSALEDIRSSMVADDGPQTSAAEYYANAFQVDKGIEIEVDNFYDVVPQVQPNEQEVGEIPQAVLPENGTNSDEALNDFLDSVDITNIEPVIDEASTGFEEDVRMLFSEVQGNNGEVPGRYLACILESDVNLDDAGALPVDGGGEQAMPQSAPGAATTEADAGQVFWTHVISTQVAPSHDQLFQVPEWDPAGNDLYAMLPYVRPRCRDS